jgi:nucleotide-binding universal stress UspA family protein
MTTQHFLVPMDFSAHADHALDYAIALAEKLQARLTLLHVIQQIHMGVGDVATALPYAYIQDIEAGVQVEMEKHLKRVEAAKLEGDIAIVHGVPFQCIIDLAQEKNVDLIVMGTHGRTGLQHVLLGSVAEKIVRLAPCPVLVTRGTANTPAP